MCLLLYQLYQLPPAETKALPKVVLSLARKRGMWQPLLCPVPPQQTFRKWGSTHGGASTGDANSATLTSAAALNTATLTSAAAVNTATPSIVGPDADVGSSMGSGGSSTSAAAIIGVVAAVAVTCIIAACLAKKLCCGKRSSHAEEMVRTSTFSNPVYQQGPERSGSIVIAKRIMDTSC